MAHARQNYSDLDNNDFERLCLYKESASLGIRNCLDMQAKCFKAKIFILSKDSVKTWDKHEPYLILIWENKMKTIVYTCVFYQNGVKFHIVLKINNITVYLTSL